MSTPIQTVQYSDPDLLGYEEKFLMNEKPSFFDKVAYNKRRLGQETLKLMIPVRSYIRVKALLEFLPSDYELEISDIVEMLVADTLYQYGKEVTPRNTFATVRQMERNAKLRENGKMFELFSEQVKCKKTRIQIDYKKLLFLEGVMEDMDLAIEECNYTVEQFLSILFIDFVKRLRQGQVPDLARRIKKFVEGGETA